MMNDAEHGAPAAGSRGPPQKVAIVTGGAGAGIGQGITLELTATGGAVVIVDRAARPLPRDPGGDSEIEIEGIGALTNPVALESA